ncbi:MAG: CopD family protein, partial [Paenisporosarcina sp.]
LLLSALWIAGLFYILTLWKKGSAEAFVPTFSKMALISIISLTVTGSIYAWLLAPNLSSLWTTTWGYWLLAKIVAVIGVFVLGALIRRHMKKTGTLSERRYLYFDGVLAITILGIVGVLTQLSSFL